MVVEKIYEDLYLEYGNRLEYKRRVFILVEIKESMILDRGKVLKKIKIEIFRVYFFFV